MKILKMNYDLPDHQLIYENNIVELQKRNQSFWKQKKFQIVEGLGDANGVSIKVWANGVWKFAKTINNSSIGWQTFSNTNAFKNATTFYLKPNFVIEVPKIYPWLRCHLHLAQQTKEKGPGG